MIAIFVAIGIITALCFFDIYYTNKQHAEKLVRYKSILNDLKPGFRYPYWRLEEMLDLKNKQEQEKK